MAEYQVIAVRRFNKFWRNYKKSQVALVCFYYVITIFFIAIFASIIAPAKMIALDPRKVLQPPQLNHLLGTDNIGRDLLGVIIHGARISLAVGLLAGILTSIIGVGVGVVAGYFGGYIDDLLMRITDGFLMLPALPLILVVVAVFGPSIRNLIIVIAVLSWTGMARVIRAETLSLMSRDFILAEKALGASSLRIILRHLLPNQMGIIPVYTSISISGAILTEAAVAFLGLAPISNSWGFVLFIAMSYWLRGAWWLVVFPGLMIFMTSLAFYMVGQGIDDAMNPQRRRTLL